VRHQMTATKTKGSWSCRRIYSVKLEIRNPKAMKPPGAAKSGGVMRRLSLIRQSLNFAGHARFWNAGWTPSKTTERNESRGQY
jgi:hypothetical protein